MDSQKYLTSILNKSLYRILFENKVYFRFPRKVSEFRVRQDSAILMKTHLTLDFYIPAYSQSPSRGVTAVQCSAFLSRDGDPSQVWRLANAVVQTDWSCCGDVRSSDHRNAGWRVLQSCSAAGGLALLHCRFSLKQIHSRSSHGTVMKSFRFLLAYLCLSAWLYLPGPLPGWPAGWGD